MPEIKVSVDSAAVQQMLREAPAKVENRLNRVLRVVSIETQREMRQRANVGVTGDLRQSVKYQVGKLEASIGPTAKHAQYVEHGTKPHWTSVKDGTPLAKWAKAKGISPFAVQRSIAKKGTKAHPFVGPTFKFMEPRIKRRFNTEIDKLIQELSAS